MAVTTTIQIDEDTWKELNGRKAPGETFDDVVNRLLKETDGGRGR